MKGKLLLAANGLLFCFAALILGTLQASLWYQVFGYFPAPALWICVVAFVGLYRPLPEAAAVIYASSFIISPMTVMPMGLIMIAAMAVGLTVKFVKQRIYWPGSGYFMIVCGASALLFHIFHLIGSLIFEAHGLSSPEIGDWLIEALLTPLAAPALYAIFWRLDRLTGREHPMEAGVAA